METPVSVINPSFLLRINCLIHQQRGGIQVDPAGLYLMLSNQLQAHAQTMNHNFANMKDQINRRIDTQMRSAVENFSNTMSGRDLSSPTSNRRTRQKVRRKDAPIHVHKEHPKKNLLKVSAIVNEEWKYGC